METETEDITSSINNLKSNYSRSRRRKRKTRGGYNKSRAGLATSPRTNSASRPLSPRDITPVIINGENISPVNEFDPISVPSPIMRPASPREAVPGESELRSPSLLRQLSPSPSSGTRFIGPASPTAFIPSELPSIAAEVPPTDDANLLMILQLNFFTIPLEKIFSKKKEKKKKTKGYIKKERRKEKRKR